jgi:hypothetical protein
LIAQNTFTIATSIIASLMAVFVLIFGDKIIFSPPKNKKLILILLVIIFAGVVASSYDILYAPPKSKDLLSLLLFFLKNKWIAFLITIFFKTLFVYWIAFFILGFFNRNRVFKTVAKIFGVEFSQELTPEHAEKAIEGYKQLENQLTSITNINKESAKYISSSFEQELLAADSTEQMTEVFREKIKNILITAYANIEGIKIYVIPASTDEIAKLGEKLGAIVETTWNGEDISEINQKIGVIAYGLIAGLETIIVIDPSAASYELTDAEIYSISSLLASLASIIGWATQGPVYLENS